MTLTATKPKSKPTPKQTTMSLPHKFYEEEIKTFTDNLCEQINEITSLEIEKKEVTGDLNRKIKMLTKQTKVLAHKIQDGEEYREIAVEVMYNYPEDGMKTITRMDTYEQWSDEMLPGENTLDNLAPVQDGSNDEEE